LPAWAAAAGHSPTHAQARHEASERTAATKLKSIRAEIERITRKVTAEQLERDRFTRELQAAERAVDAAREALEGVRHERADGAVRRTRIDSERRQKESDLDHDREDLEAQLRAAYVIGGAEPLKLLLNQQDPSRTGRMFVYYSYFGQARAREIQHVEEGVQQLARLTGALASQDAKLADLERQHSARLASLEQARARRSQVLASLEAESRSSEKQLARLKGQQAGLEKLLTELRQAVERFPVDTHSAFDKLRGRLTWPVGGSQILARFGDPRAGGIKWDGMLLSAEAGEPVHAVYQGRVVYADWLPGLGLLSIIDHGDGYMSLYGHNQQLYKGVGEEVQAGETIAAAGDSGGSNRPELYFEIRKSGKPVDPRPWFRQAHP
jgi:septal ring factor EnvC (AmiA/AmiB activator)